MTTNTNTKGTNTMTTTNGPTYPIEVHLIGHDGNAFNVIGRVRLAIAAYAGQEAAADFAAQATQCGSYDELLAFVMATVDVV